jgi:ABC-type nitrate/sulfonate/bicarbonate transport system substrate-binding protein
MASAFGGEGNEMLRRIAILSFCGALAAVATACGGSSSTSGAAQPKILQNVTITAPATEQSYAIWVAQAQGFFTQQGLKVSLLPSSSGGSDTIAVVESGSSQFAVQDSVVPTTAIEKGATIKYLLMLETSASQQISISNAAVAAKKIKTNGSATAAIKSMKNSHLTIGVSTVASSSYSWLYSLAHAQGLKIGANGDINIQTLGTPQNEIVAINAGRVDAVAGVPPTTTQPDTYGIKLDQVSPFNHMAGSYLLTSNKMIKDDPKTVQELVTALLNACEFISKHTAQARKDVVNALRAADPTITVAVAQSDFATALPHFQNPYPNKTGFELLQKLTNGQPPAGTFPAYTKAVDPKFAKTALTQAGLPVPKD